MAEEQHSTWRRHYHAEMIMEGRATLHRKFQNLNHFDMNPHFYKFRPNRSTTECFHLTEIYESAGRETEEYTAYLWICNKHMTVPITKVFLVP